MTARQPKPRPVVRVVIEVYPKLADADAVGGITETMRDHLGPFYDPALDYRRPRVVSVKRVRSK